MTEPLIDVTGHRRRRQLTRRRQWWRRLGIAGAVLAAVGAVLWLLYASPLLVVRTVVVEGNRLVPTEQIVAEAGVAEGTPLIRVDERAVAQRVGELPAVANVALERRWPSTLVVKVTERAVRLVLASDGGFDWVDASGVAFHHAAERPEGTMLVEADRNDEAVLAAIVSTANALPPDVLARARAISATTVDSIVVKLDGGAQIVWGSAEDSDLKARVVIPLLGVKATVYDVSSPANPTTR